MRFIETIVKEVFIVKTIVLNEVYRNYSKRGCIETIVKEVYRNYSKICL